MKTEINTDLQIFVTQKKTNALNKAYYLTYRKNGDSGHKKYSSSANLLTALDGLDLIAGTWLTPAIGGEVFLFQSPLLLDGETSIPDDEEVKTVISFKLIATSLVFTGTQPVILAVLKGAGIGAQEPTFLTLASNQTVKDLTTQIL